MEDSECLLKIDYQFPDETRLIGLLSNESLEILALKQGRNWGYWPKTLSKLSNSSKLCVIGVVIIGLYDPKTGSKLELSGPKWGHNSVVIP
jgi:hypothetical protein